MDTKVILQQEEVPFHSILKESEHLQNQLQILFYFLLVDLKHSQACVCCLFLGFGHDLYILDLLSNDEVDLLKDILRLGEVGHEVINGLLDLIVSSLKHRINELQKGHH